MRALKVLVAAMGAMLVAGVVALAILVGLRIERGAPQREANTGPRREALPAGSHILAAELVGDRLMLRVALADGGEEIRLYDARSGVPVAILVRAPPP
jgi:hypothetical protein